MTNVGERVGLLRPANFQLDLHPEGMLVSRVSTFTNRRNEMVLPITLEQFDRWQLDGELIQNVFPHLTAEQREFLMSGATPGEWADAFGPDEDEEDPL